VVLEACARDESAFREVPWPPELEELRRRLEAADGVRERFYVRPGSILDPPLVVLYPLFRPAAGAGPGFGQFRVDGLLFVQLDPAFLREDLFPRLAEAHFGPLAQSEFEVAVLRKTDRSAVYASAPRAGTGGRRSGEVERTLGGPGGRPGRRPGDHPGGRPPGGRPGADVPSDRTAREQPRPPDDEGPFLLLARHRGGSLEQAVARVRRNNLALGLGVLFLLGATAVLLAAGAQRARRLARQQMEFVAGVTHELNTPLAAIRSAGQNLADGIVTDPAQVRRYGGLIEKEGGRLTALVAQVLDFAGIEAGGRAYASDPVAVDDVVDAVLRDHRLVLEQAGMAVERDVAPGLPRLAGDAAALRRALANLVANAAKFAASGRWLAVRAAGSADGRRVVLRVEDRGPGIAREERGRVFEPFHRGAAAESNATPGAGLGLSLVRHVVAAHGGSVRIEGREGGGTAVVVELPVAPEGSGA
jgi:signal transduction histidine kinase